MSTKDKHLLILGGGQMQIPAIHIAREMGCHVIVADGNPSVPGREEASEFLHIDLKEKESLAAWALKRQQKGRLDGVYTAGTDFSASVAWVAEACGLPGISYQAALNASDKGRMRTCFAEAGLSSPAHVTLSPGEEWQQALAESGLSGELVIKPVDNMGGRGIQRVIWPGDDLSRAVEESRANSRTSTVIIEECVNGPEFSLDAVVCKGRVFVTGLADRHIFYPPRFIEMGHTMPSREGDRVVRDLIDTFKAGMRALGITDGAAKGDLRHDGEKAVIGEIAARLSGGYMSGWTYPYSSGSCATRASIRIALNLEPDLIPESRNLFAAERAFISLPGKINSVSGLVEASRLPGIRDLFTRIKIGDRVLFPRNNVEKAGNVISVADEYEDASRRAMAAVSMIRIGLEPGDPETESALFGKNRIPAAYPGLADNRELPAFDESPLWASSTPWIDWNGVGINAAQDILKSRGIEPRASRLGELFWTVLGRGGVQGVLWAEETLAAAGDDKKQQELLERWQSGLV